MELLPDLLYYNIFRLSTVDEFICFLLNIRIGKHLSDSVKCLMKPLFSAPNINLMIHSLKQMLGIMTKIALLINNLIIIHKYLLHGEKNEKECNKMLALHRQSFLHKIAVVLHNVELKYSFFISTYCLVRTWILWKTWAYKRVFRVLSKIKEDVL